MGVGLSVALLLPGFIVVRSSSEDPPERPQTAASAPAHEREVISITGALLEGPSSPDALQTPVGDWPGDTARVGGGDAYDQAVEDSLAGGPEDAFDRVVQDSLSRGVEDSLARGVEDSFEDGVEDSFETELVAVVEPDAPAATELLSIEISNTADGQGSVIQLRADGSISDAIPFAIEDPDRLVIDLPDMASAVELPLADWDSDRVAGVRVGKHEDMVRVVLDSGDAADAFEGWRGVPARDGLRIELGSVNVAEAAEPAQQMSEAKPTQGLAEAEPVPAHVDVMPLKIDSEPQPVASIAPPSAEVDPAKSQPPPAQDPAQLPLYLLGEGRGAGRPMHGGPPLDGSYDCIIEPFAVVEVGSALTAVVKSVGVERSDFVEVGHVLAELEASPERARVAVAQARATMDGNLIARRARLELGRRKRDRADQLFESNALSADMRDEIRTEAEVARAVVKEARENKALMELEFQEAIERLDEHTIRSPITGVVIDRLKSPGEVVKEETIVVLAQIDPLRIEVILPAAVFGAVQAGMRAEVTPEIPNAGIQVASVTVVDRVVDGTSGTFGVRLELPNADYAVPSGLRCQVRFLQAD